MVTNPAINNRQPLSLWARLIILFLVMILPFIAFSAFKAYDIVRHLEKEAQKESLNLSKNVAHDIDDYIDSTGDVLLAVAENKDIRTQNFKAAKPWLERILAKYKFYNLIAFVDPTGNIKTAAMSTTWAKSEDAKKMGLNVSDTACYRRGIISNSVSVGDFMYSKLTGIPVVHVTYPVFDFSGKRLGFVAAALDLTIIQNKLMKSGIPKHIEIGVIDDKGIIIARNQDPEKFIGEDISKETVFRNMLGKSNGFDKVLSPDGITRVFGFTTTTRAPWYVKTGVSTGYIQNQAKAELIHHFLIFIPLLLIAVFGWFWIGKDVNKLHKETERLSLIDPLTELWNSRKLHQDLNVELSRAKRYNEQLSFAMIDIDHFKHYNDRNGHQLGDKALSTIAAIIRNTVREIDLAYRYGGEEICVLIPGTGKDGATSLAERIRANIDEAIFTGQENLPSENLTVSIGTATYPQDAQTEEELIKCADAALYRAKNKGRNRVEVFDGLSVGFCDIVELKRVEEERAQMADRMRLILESTDEGIYGVDVEGHCIIFNRAASEMTGYKPEEVLGKNIHDLIHHSRNDGSHYPDSECPVFLAIKHGHGMRVVDEIIWRKDGTCFPVEHSSHPIIEGGIIKGAVVTFTDISKRKQAEKPTNRIA